MSIGYVALISKRGNRKFGSVACAPLCCLCGLSVSSCA